MTIPELTIDSTFKSKKVSLHTDTTISLITGGRGKETIVFIHGWTCNKNYWASQLRYFSQTHRVIAMDLPAHGESSIQEKNLTINSIANDLKSLFSKMNINSATLVGHSLGGAVALETSILCGVDQFPIIAIDSLYSPAYRKMTDKDIRKDLDYFRPDFSSSVRIFIKNFFLDSATTELVEEVAEQCASTFAESSLSLLESLYHWDLYKFLPKIKTPVNCICEANAHKKMSDPNNKKHFNMKIIPNTGHFCMLDAPEIVNSEIEAFMKK